MLKFHHYKQRGFALVELTVALVVVAILGIYASNRLVQDADDAVAQGAGTYVASAAVWANRYVLLNWEPLSSSGSVTGTVSPLQPTLAELSALGRVPSAFPVRSPSSQTIRFDILKTNCPGQNCILTATACLTSPLTVRGRVRDDLATIAMVNMKGDGGRSQTDQPTSVRGPSFNMANPVSGQPAGIVCAQTVTDTALYDTFVKRFDIRNPSLQGGASIAGNLPNGYTLDVTGKANVSSDLNVGGSVTIGGIGAIGGACSPENSLVQGTVGGVAVILKCQSGVYVPTGMTVGTVGASCSPEGRIAMTSSGSSIVCRGGSYRPIEDLLGKQGLLNMAIYSNGAVIPTPTCGANMTPLLMPMGIITACVVGGGTCSNNTGSFQGVIAAGNVVTITGSNGLSAGTAQMAVASLCSIS
jgi:prepilin-type N-terminal cleavage/methylation domain-containing protein